MLTTETWDKILPLKDSRGVYLCEDCMIGLLGRPLIGTDLRDCPMNYGHPEYTNHHLM